jgi:cytochrome c553
MTGNPENGKKIFMEGKGAAAPCMSCHGPTGLGNEAMGAPRLANLGYTYIIKQLNDLADGRRVPEGPGAVMPGFAQQLSAQDRQDVSAYVNTVTELPELSDLKDIKASGQPVGTLYKGKIIAVYGTAKVSACQSCHSFNGRGASPMFPVVGQQRYSYLVNQLHNWRDGSRHNDPYGMMQAVAKKLSDEDIINVAAYLSQAPRTTVGGQDATTKSQAAQ